LCSTTAKVSRADKAKRKRRKGQEKLESGKRQKESLAKVFRISFFSILTHCLNLEGIAAERGRAAEKGGVVWPNARLQFAKRARIANRKIGLRPAGMMGIFQRDKFAGGVFESKLYA